VPYFDNPAGRLHDLLSRLAEQPPSNSVIGAWAEVLGVEMRDVILRLGDVANLVPQIQAAAESGNEPALVDSVTRYRDAWAKPIFPVDSAFNAELHRVLPDGPAMETLNLVSAQLHRIAPDGMVPDEEELAKLKARLREISDEIQVADEIPEELRGLIVDRLGDAVSALEHLNVGGPGAVKRAMEALIGSVLTTPKNRGIAVGSEKIKKMLAIAGVIWVGFTAGQEVPKSIEGWGTTIQLLTPGQDDTNGDAAQSPSAAEHVDGGGGGPRQEHSAAPEGAEASSAPSDP
jgi:hypothetical protein